MKRTTTFIRNIWVILILISFQSFSQTVIFSDDFETDKGWVLTGEFGIFMGWVDEFRTMGVRTNAETPEDAKTAVKFGADGIGLCRTEHMFFETERLPMSRR